MKKYSLSNGLTLIITVFLLLGCSKSDDQKEFEEQAFSNPSNITETTANAQIESTDPDDWRISPMYQGLINITVPPYPNPVVRDAEFRIDIDITGIRSVPGINIYVFLLVDQNRSFIRSLDQQELPGGSQTIVLTSSGFPSASTNSIYRMVFFDNNQNVITYGDILVQ